MTRVLVFDSGVGGLSVLQEMRAQGCADAFGYLADTGFFPYGVKSDAALIERLPRLLKAATEKHRFDAVVVACNTASTIALTQIRTALNVPVVGTVPAIKPACGLSHSRVVGLLGTPGTVRRSYTDDLIEEFAGDCAVVRHGSAELVELAERKLIDGSVPASEVGAAIQPLFEDVRGGEIDTVVLACTHFPLLKKELKAALQKSIQWVDSGAAIARQTSKVLQETPARQSGSEYLLLVTSDDVSAKLRAAFAAQGLTQVDQISL